MTLECLESVQRRMLVNTHTHTVILHKSFSCANYFPNISQEGTEFTGLYHSTLLLGKGILWVKAVKGDWYINLPLGGVLEGDINYCGSVFSNTDSFESFLAV